MFFVKNIVSGNFKVKYSKSFNSFIVTNNKSSVCSYTPLKFFNNKDENNLLQQICKIGNCFDILVEKLDNNTNDKHKIKYEIIYNYIKEIKNKEDKSLYTYLLYNIYYSLIINFKLDDASIIQPPFHLNNENIYTNDFLIDYIDESKNSDYINSLLNNILDILNSHKGQPIEINSSNIVPFIFEVDVSKYLINDFNGVRKEYRDFLRSLEKLCNKFGIPIMINLSKEDKLETINLPNSNQIEVTTSKYSNLLNKLNSTYNNQIYPSYDSIDIKNIEINLNDFIIECYYIYHLFDLSNTLLKNKLFKKKLLENKFIVPEDKYNYIQDELVKIFSYYYSNPENIYETNDMIKHIENELFNQINHFKQNTLDNLKCNNIKIDSDIITTTINLVNETNHLNLDLDIYSSISLALLDLLSNKYFNQIILEDKYVSKCNHCNTSISKPHTLKFTNNIYNIPIYLCDSCFKKWSNKCNNNRVKKCNDIKNS